MLDTYLLILIAWFGAGSGLAVINNLAQINRARHGESTAEATLVSLTSSGNALGRIFFGQIGDAMLCSLHQRFHPIPHPMCRPTIDNARGSTPTHASATVAHGRSSCLTVHGSP